MKVSASKKDLPWLRQVSSFTASRIILTANNFRIFDHISSAGRTYTPKEISGWLKKAGLKDIKTTSLDETVLIEGIKALP